LHPGPAHAPQGSNAWAERLHAQSLQGLIVFILPGAQLAAGRRQRSLFY
jgi:hypothetical protein